MVTSSALTMPGANCFVDIGLGHVGWWVGQIDRVYMSASRLASLSKYIGIHHTQYTKTRTHLDIRCIPRPVPQRQPPHRRGNDHGGSALPRITPTAAAHAAGPLEERDGRVVGGRGGGGFLGELVGAVGVEVRDEGDGGAAPGDLCTRVYVHF